MAAFNVNLGNKMVMRSAETGRKSNRLQFDDGNESTDCFGKNKSKSKLQKERIKQFSIWFEEVDSARQKQYAQRRFGRQLSRLKRQNRVRCYRRLFIPTAICWLVGFCTLLGSSVQSIGEGTIFWTLRDKFQIIGTVTLSIGFVLLMVSEGLISHHQMIIKKLETIIVNPDVEIDVNSEDEPRMNAGQKTLRNISNKVREDMTPGEKTLKNISSQVPRLYQDQMEERTNASEKDPLFSKETESATKQDFSASQQSHSDSKNTDSSAFLVDECGKTCKMSKMDL